MFTPGMTFPPLGVKILQHEIFTPVHWGKHFFALNFHLLGWGKNIIASNIDLFPWGENIIVSNIHLSCGGKNIIPSNIYPFHWVRIFYRQIFTPFHG